MIDLIPFAFVVLVIIATVAVGLSATRKAKTASDFFVAGRSVNAFLNAAAISGEYLSAASFMGIAGLIMKNGYDALWYPVGYAAGYLFLLLFIAGPLRRFGAYTIPDFAEGRFDSPTFRKIAVTFVLFIGLAYTPAQMKGAGITMTSVLGWPYWAGIVVVGAIITFNVALGGMKGITLVQAFQYWAKLFAISLPVFVLMTVFGGYGKPIDEAATRPNEMPRFGKDTTLTFKGKRDAPLNAVSFTAAEPSTVRFPDGAVIDKVTTARKPEPGEDPVPLSRLVGGVPALEPTADGIRLAAGTELTLTPAEVTRGGSPVLKDGKPVKAGAKIEIGSAVPPAEKVRAAFPAGNAVPNAAPNKKWVEPYGTMTSKYGFPLLYTYSLIIALVCGTAGLPHILVRFYTNPDGKSAKRTTMIVMVMLGAFYIFTPIWGAMGRGALPELYANNSTDSVVLKLPAAFSDPLVGKILAGITSAGAFAAFMSTFSGLLVSMSGAFAHDIYGKILRPDSSSESRLKAFKFAAVGIGIVSMLLGLVVESFDIATLVGWAFAVAAASYFPLLLLGAWWGGLTKYGGAVGMLTGGLLSLAAIITTMLLDKKVLTFEVAPLLRALMEQPAVWGVPLALGTMVVVSLLTKDRLPNDVPTKMLRLHAPESMGLSKNYIEH
jgi:cation/acetate symporter